MYRIQPETWGSSAQQYDSFEKKWHFYGTVADAMLRELPLKEDSRVLELACGTGVCTLKLAAIARRGEVVALDFAEAMIETARKNTIEAGFSNVDFVRGDAAEASRLLSGRKFDFAVCNSAFWHFPEPRKVLDGLRGLLSPSGEFALTSPSWVEVDSPARDEIRAKIREILLRNSVKPDDIDKAREQARQRSSRADLSSLFREHRFEHREVQFEFSSTLESRLEWRQIPVFSSNRWMQWADNLDPSVQKEIREEMEAWRRTNPGRDPLLSRWKVYIARPVPGWPTA